jgi:hypothetical protein
MPAVNPRIAVYLPRNVAVTVQRLSALRGVSRSAVIRDFLIEAEPVLTRVANLLDLAARTDRNALKEWAATMQAAQSSMEAEATRAFATMDDMERHLAKRPKKPASGQQAPARRGGRRRTPGQ